VIIMAHRIKDNVRYKHECPCGHTFFALYSYVHCDLCGNPSLSMKPDDVGDLKSHGEARAVEMQVRTPDRVQPTDNTEIFF